MNTILQKTKQKNYNIYNVAGDGECLFNAVAYGILFNMDQSNITKREYKLLAKQLRAHVVKQLEIRKRNENIKHNMGYNIHILSEQMQTKEKRKELREMNHDYYRTYYANERLHVFSEHQRINMYINQMKKSCTWGGSLEAFILAQYVQNNYDFKGIQVFDQNFVKINHYGGGNDSMVTNNKRGPIVKLRLLGVEKYVKNGKIHSKGSGSHFQFIVDTKNNHNQMLSVSQIHKELTSKNTQTQKSKRKLLTENEIEKILKRVDVLVPVFRKTSFKPKTIQLTKNEKMLLNRIF